MKSRIRILVISVALVLVLSLLAVGCPPPAVDPVDPIEPPLEVIRWIAQSEDPTGAFTFVSFERANRKIEELSGGRLVIESHPGGAIVPADTEHHAVDKGILDMASMHSVHWVDISPAGPLFTYKIGGPTALEYYFWFKVGPGLDLANELFARAGFNVKAIAAMAREPEVFLYTAEPLETVECLDGLKLRLLGDEAVIFDRLGVAPVATPTGEIYDAMAKGVIDGFQHVSFAFDWELGFHEVVRYAYVSPVRAPTCVFLWIVNKDSWAALPEDLQLLVKEVLWAEGIRHYAEISLRETVAAEKWIDYGVIVKPIPEEIEEAVIREAMRHYAEMAAKCPFYAEVLESLRAWAEAYYATFPRL